VTDTRLDVLAIGNAIVDVIATADDDFLTRESLPKGSMRLIDAEEAKRLYGLMGQAREISGGSGANTVAGVAALGGRGGFIGQVAEDQLGEVFAHDIRAVGVEFETAAADYGIPTARCLILVTPDAQRTMNTFLGASQRLPATALDTKQIEGAAILYLEGYMWDPAEPREAMMRAVQIARSAKRKVALTLSDTFVIDRHRESLMSFIDNGLCDILFANEAEILSLAQEGDFDRAIEATAVKVETLVVTRSENGAIAVQDKERFEVAAEPVAKVVDTTGAGDLFAAGFLVGYRQDRPLDQCLRMGAIAAAEVISHYGARTEADLKALVAQKLG
jgi:sugar/nucleoside kinase (ribokinase family)